MDEQSIENLRHADRNSEPVRLVFRDGSVVEARIRDIDWDKHHSLTYLDMDAPCRALTTELDRIAEIAPIPAASRGARAQTDGGGDATRPR